MAVVKAVEGNKVGLAAVAGSRELALTTLDAWPEPVAVMTGDGEGKGSKLVWANAAFEAMTAYPPGGLEGRAASMLSTDNWFRYDDGRKSGWSDSRAVDLTTATSATISQRFRALPVTLMDGRKAVAFVAAPGPQSSLADRLHREGRKVIELIAGAQPLQTTLSALTDVVDGLDPGHIASIRLAEPISGSLGYAHGARVPTAWRGWTDRHPVSFIGRDALALIDIVDGVMVLDFSREDIFGADLRAAAGDCGLCGAWIYLLRDTSGQALGSFSLLRQQQGAPSAEERELLRDAARLAMVAFESDRNRKALVESEERFRNVAEQLSDWVWETDERFRITYVSRSIEDSIGIPREKVVGRRATDMAADDEHASMYAKEFVSLLRRRQPFSQIRLALRAADGSVRICRLSGEPRRDSLGRFAGYRGAGRDESDVIESERGLAQARAHLSEAIESIEEGFLLFDDDDKLLLCNHRATELVASTGMTVAPGVARARLAERMLQTCADDGVPRSIGTWIDRPEGNRSFELRQSGGKWLAIEERPTNGGGTVSIWRDVTETKNREFELYAAKEAAELASRSKSEFLANMSHELRTPLNAIIGFAEILHQELFGDIGNESYKEYAHDIAESGVHLLELINDLLDIAKLEVGQQDLDQAPQSLDKLVLSCQRMVRERAAAARLALIVNLPQPPVELHVDERRVKQIILNLLSNAIKFTPEGGEIRVTARAEASSGDILLTVSDTGIGMNKEEIPLALNMFGQIDASLSRKYEGAGLGLPLSKTLIELHGGGLEIDSAPGQGTRVTVRFPADRVVVENYPAGSAAE